MVSRCEACGLARPWNDPRADFDRAKRTLPSAVFGAFEDSRVLASVMVCFDVHRGRVCYLAVSDEQQRRGISRRMMSAAEEWLRLHGDVKIQLVVRVDNGTALAFYERLGPRTKKEAVATLGWWPDGR